MKVGEGTYGEAFKINNYVCKIVPFDGDFRVNVFVWLLIYEYPIAQGKYTCGPKWFWNVAVHSQWQEYVNQNAWINNIYYWLHFIYNKHRWALDILALVWYRVLNLSLVIYD